MKVIGRRVEKVKERREEGLTQCPDRKSRMMRVSILQLMREVALGLAVKGLHNVVMFDKLRLAVVV